MSPVREPPIAIFSPPGIKPTPASRFSSKRRRNSRSCSDSRRIRMKPPFTIVSLMLAVAAQSPLAQSFKWPDGKHAAVSLSFDDARASQIDLGLELLKKQAVKVTFFLTANNVERRLPGWKQAIADGHEIRHPSMNHPRTGNDASSERNALETYTLQMMADQLDQANDQIQKLLGVRPATFAYPCGLKFVGKGRDVKSYVPLVAERF